MGIILKWIIRICRYMLSYIHQHNLLELLIFIFIWQVLERLSFGGSRIRDTVVAQSRILLFWYCTTYLLLKKNNPKYQRLEQPPLDQLQPQLQLEPSTIDMVEPYQQLEPPLPDQVESNQQLESPPLDQLRPFILEGAK
ncbi:hypothetical protein L1049_006176 [Liquidambar formosana]|uniref:Uncharacterized protein n=1 Tax=Liquidambar formosana TaxID=63359 RepID=A0AAP0WTW3_LIQFO